MFEQLVEDMMALLDNLAVWDVESDGGWKEMARLGLCLLIQYASQPDLEVGIPVYISSCMLVGYSCRSFAHWENFGTDQKATDPL